MSDTIGRFKTVDFSVEPNPSSGMFLVGIDVLTNNLSIKNSAGLTRPVSANGMQFLVTGGGTDAIYNMIQTAPAYSTIVVDGGTYYENKEWTKPNITVILMGSNIINTLTVVLAYINPLNLTSNSYFQVLGDGIFTLTSKYLIYNQSSYEENTNRIINIEINSFQSTGGFISMLGDNNGKGNSRYLNVKANAVSCSGGHSIYLCYADMCNFNINTNLNTGSYSCLLVTQYLMSTSVNYDGNLIQGNTSTVVVSNTSSSLLKVECSLIKGINALNITDGSDGMSLGTIINSKIIGNVSVVGSGDSSAPTQAILYGSIAGALTVSGNYSILDLHAMMEGNYSDNPVSSISLLGTNNTINQIGGVNKAVILVNGVNNQYNQIGEIYSNDNGYQTSITVTSGTFNHLNKLYWGGYYTTALPQAITINGGTFICSDVIKNDNNGYLLPLIAMSSGYFKLNTKGSIENNANQSLAYCLGVTGGTFVHDGGTLYSQYGTYSINIAAGVTMPVINKNNWYGNKPINLNGTGIYSNQIILGGNSIIDSNII